MKNDVLVQTRISKEERRTLDDRAHSEGISRADLVRRFILHALSEQGDEFDKRVRAIVQDELRKGRGA